MEFEYKAIDSNGSRHQGTIEANDQAQAQQRLNAEGLSPIEIKVIAKSSSFSGLFTQKVTLDQLEFFTSELSLLLESGVRVDKGIDIIRQSNSDPALGRLLNQIASSIKKRGIAQPSVWQT